MSYNDLRKGRFSQINQEYFITFNTKNRSPLFTDLNISQITINEILNLESGSKWLAWVLMPDHFHGILLLKNSDLSKVIKNCKARSAIKINKYLDRKGNVWQSGFYDRLIRREEDRVGIARYIVANPLRARLVKKISDYPYWDSVWLK